MRKYDSYKDSGIEWIGEIPSHWDSSRYRYFYFSNMGVTLLKEDVKEDGIYPVYSATETDVLFGYVDEASVILNEGDIVIPARGNSIGHIKVVTTPSTSTQTTIYSKKISQNIETNFVKYFLQGLREHLFQFDRTAIPQITVNQVKNNPLVIPTPEEQTAIAAYLDRKTAEIDELIADKKRLLELYEEEKTAIINQAVTKGINPDAPMKDSGIEWLGEIPEHWEVRKANSLITVKRGAGYQYITEVFGDEEFEYVLRISDFNNYDPIRALKTEELGKYRVTTGEILIAGTGASAGITMYVDERMDGLVHSYNALRISVSKPFVLFNKYLFFLFQSHILNEQMSLAFTGSAQHFLDVGRITSFLITLPEFQEQKSIAHHIETECARIDAKKAKTEKLIELLIEYRTALISEVVTGKVKVIE